MNRWNPRGKPQETKVRTRCPRTELGNHGSSLKLRCEESLQVGGLLSIIFILIPFYFFCQVSVEVEERSRVVRSQRGSFRRVSPFLVFNNTSNFLQTRRKKEIERERDNRSSGDAPTRYPRSQNAVSDHYTEQTKSKTPLWPNIHPHWAITRHESLLPLLEKGIKKLNFWESEI